MLPPRAPVLPTAPTRKSEEAVLHTLHEHSQELLSRASVEVNDISASYLYAINETSHYTCFLVHGAGQCSNSFTLLAELLAPSYTVFCPDLRGHGNTWRGQGSEDLSIDQLLKDFVEFVRATLITHEKESTQLVLVGHSMGGGVVAKAVPKLAEQLPSVKVFGVVLLDVCEELAMASLGASRDFAKRIPPQFASIDAAIDWVTAHTVANHRSATISTPPLLYSGQVENDENSFSEETGAAPRVSDKVVYKWKINLLSTEKYWRGWFEGLNTAFLHATGVANKILVTAGIHSVDSELAIAQMQGKIQIEILTKTGHVIHEDQADSVGAILLDVVRRQELLRKILSEQKQCS